MEIINLNDITFFVKTLGQVAGVDKNTHKKSNES